MNTTHKKLIDPHVAQNELIEKLGIQNLPEDEQLEVISGFIDGCMQQATALILSQLPEDGIKKVDGLIEAGEIDAVNAYVQKHVPNAAEIMDEAIKIGIEEFKALVKERV